MDTDGLVAAYVLDGAGHGTAADWEAVRSWRPGDGVLWVHLDRNAEAACRWLRDESGVDSITAEALLAEETRPRTFDAAAGLVVILRGVNLNPGADPEDMMSLRLYADDTRVITVRLRNLMAVSGVVDDLGKGKGPRTAGHFVARIADRLVARMAPVVDDLGEGVDGLETDLSTLSPRDLRHTAIVLRRYLIPQRDIMGRPQLEQSAWLSQHDRLTLREVGDRIARHIEELEEVRERAAVLQDELMNRLSETSNRTIYLLTIIAAVMLPLSFVTGLLGVNVGGIPGVENTGAFWLLCAVLAVFGLAELWLFRKLKWI